MQMIHRAALGLALLLAATAAQALTATELVAKNIEARHEWDYLPFPRQYWNDVGLVYELTGSADATFYYEQALRGARYGPLQPTPAFTLSSLFAGLPAEDVLLRTVLAPGDHAVIGNDVYGGTHRRV